MRRVGSVVLVLLILGLAAAGFGSAQKRIAVPSPPAAATSQASAALLRRPLVNPMSEGAQSGADGVPVLSGEPIRISEATRTAQASSDAPAPNASAQSKSSSIQPCDKPSGMGLSRIVEIDTTGGPGFGFEHFKQYDFLRDKEVILTFDDGPWPGSTPAVLRALADECLKGTFFEIGEHATWHPEITKQVIDAGMTQRFGA
jgi:hypothetical protein